METGWVITNKGIDESVAMEKTTPLHSLMFKWSKQLHLFQLQEEINQSLDLHFDSQSTTVMHAQIALRLKSLSTIST